MCSLEHVKLSLGLGELLLRDLWLEDFLDIFPELLVLLIKKNDKTRGLRVERRGNMLDGLGDKLLDAGIADGDLVRERVDGASEAGGLEEGDFVRHMWTCCV